MLFKILETHLVEIVKHPSQWLDVIGSAFFLEKRESFKWANNTF